MDYEAESSSLVNKRLQAKANKTYMMEKLDWALRLPQYQRPSAGVLFQETPATDWKNIIGRGFCVSYRQMLNSLQKYHFYWLLPKLALPVNVGAHLMQPGTVFYFKVVSWNHKNWKAASPAFQLTLGTTGRPETKDLTPWPHRECQLGRFKRF